VNHVPTIRTQELMKELRELAGEIDARLLPRASVAAQAEWFALRRVWPDDVAIVDGARGISDEELGWMVGKVRRFRQILRGPDTAALAPVRRPARGASALAIAAA
jgi:hypothetical protein